MSDSLEPEREPGESGFQITLAEAAARLGCHVETLRIRIRNRDLTARRGPHGRYYVSADEVAAIRRPRRMKRRVLDDEALAGLPRRLDELLEPGRLMAWQREQLQRLHEDDRSDLPLFRVIAARHLLAEGYNTAETSELLGVTVRQVYRLRRADLMVALARAWRRGKRAESGRHRRESRVIVADIQRRLAAAGFTAARRGLGRRINPDPLSDWDGLPPRLALARNLSHDQARDLLRMGLDPRQIAAISTLGIGTDELHELLVHGLPEGSPDLNVR